MSASTGARESCLIPCTRLGDCRCMETASHRNRFGNGFPYPHRRNPEHNRYHLSCLAQSAISECHLARVCVDRRWLPLRCGTADGTVRLINTTKNNLSVIQCFGTH